MPRREEGLSSYLTKDHAPPNRFTGLFSCTIFIITALICVLFTAKESLHTLTNILVSIHTIFLTLPLPQHPSTTIKLAQYTRTIQSAITSDALSVQQVWDKASLASVVVVDTTQLDVKKSL